MANCKLTRPGRSNMSFTHRALSALAAVTTLATAVAGPGQCQARMVSPLPISAPSPMFRFQPAFETRIPLRQARRSSYWLEGGIAGAVVVGILGGSLAHGLCRDSDSSAESSCLDNTMGGAVIGGALGLTVGALIGGRFPKHRKE